VDGELELVAVVERYLRNLLELAPVPDGISDRQLDASQQGSLGGVANNLPLGDGKVVLVSISPIFYEQLFHTKVFCAACMCLQFGFVIFWRKDFGAKAVHKIRVKLTPERP
jgi:hypothetical protein